MRRRWLPLLLALAAAAAAAASVSSQVPAAAPSRGRSTGTWTPPLGADGHPDLQGVWLNSSATPLERPKALEGRPSLTDEEVAELRQRPRARAATGAIDGAFQPPVACHQKVREIRSTRPAGECDDSTPRARWPRANLAVRPSDLTYDTRRHRRARPCGVDRPGSAANSHRGRVGPGDRRVWRSGYRRADDRRGAGVDDHAARVIAVTDCRASLRTSCPASARTWVSRVH